ncbi:HET-domain-containing protein [Xylariaceae sp. AK1471]|nr:HET-domain-containing protein [Xylariaceae sp. AK1471]
MEKEEHCDCRIQTMQAELPTRLLIVPGAGRSLRLGLTKHFENKASVKYLTLTHCWGSVPMPLVATRENLESLLTGIPFKRLTKSFQDAITITQRLGFQYIWIDSLCIVQDDEQDWITEASRMATAYSGCTLNLVAADAPDGSYGCFLDRKEPPQKTKIFYNGIEYQCSPNINTYLRRTAIGGRGWCFQETFLSPRSLFFCKTQLFWECRAIRAHESLALIPSWHLDLIPFRAQGIKWGHPTTPKNIAKNWLRLVTAYSRTVVTYPKDKLVAFSGVARLFGQQAKCGTNGDAPILNAGYVAGMWRVGLEYQLLWYVSWAARRPRNKSFSAPSWSWASVDGPVKSSLADFKNGGNFKIREDFKVINCTTNTTTSDRYGEVKGGTLTVMCAPLKRIQPYLERCAIH